MRFVPTVVHAIADYVVGIKELGDGSGARNANDPSPYAAEDEAQATEKSR